MEKYKISDIAKILGVSTDTLRFYETKGIVKPYKDKYTGYRYYDFWDVNYLIDALWYRSYGFPIKDVSEMISTDTLSDLTGRFEKRREEIENAIRLNELLLQLSKRHLKEWNRLPELLGKCEITIRPAHVHFEYRYTENFSHDPKVHKMAKEWLNYMPFARRYFETSAGEMKLKDSEDYSWGLTMPYNFFEELGLEMKEPLTYEGSCKCIHSCFRSSGKGGFSSKHVQYMLDYAKQHNLKILGNPTGVLLASVIDEENDNKLTGFFETWIPIEPLPATPEEDKSLQGMPTPQKYVKPPIIYTPERWGEDDME